MFRDEDLAYALRLGQAGVPVEFHLHPGAPHEFDFIAFNTTAARRHRRPRSFEHRMPLSLTGGCRAASPDK
jgi:acetyl esterase/lipase